MRLQIWKTVCGMLVLAASAGCGSGNNAPGSAGSPPPPPPNLASPQPAARPAPKPAAQPGREAGVVSGQASGRPARASAGSGDSTAAKTSNDFLLPETQPVYEVASIQESSRRRTHYVVAPVEGHAPRTFAVTPPNGGAGTVGAGAVGAGAGTSGTGGSAPQAGGRLNLPSGFSVIPSAGVHASGLPHRIRCDRDRSEMVLVPAGVFLQGTDRGPSEAQPSHPMFVSAFYIDMTEITVGQYNRFREEAKTAARSIATPDPPLNANAVAEMPAVGINWRDASNYAKFYGKDLPTEAEWEKAGRGTDGFEFPWGNGRPLWGRARTPGEISPVKSFSSDVSIYGVYDLSGNAREWVNDFYSPTAYREAVSSDGTPPRDWTGPRKSEPANLRVLKGGRGGWELWHRSPAGWRDQPADAGFRCVLRVTADMQR